MAGDKQFTAGDAILVARAAGLDTSDLERQAHEGGGDVAALHARLDEVEQRLTASSQPAGEQAPPTAGGERRFAHELLAHLNKSRTPWISTETDDASR
jgi:hypothetical protein